MSRYREIADEIAAEVAAGLLKPGDRLPPQRDFAYDRRIAVSTASRVYAELARRGLVTGEVGRGTYVRSPTAPSTWHLTEPTDAPVDLQYNFSVVAELLPDLARSLFEVLQGSGLEAAFNPASAVGTAAHKGIAARFLSRGGWTPEPDAIVFTGNGRQALAAALAAVAPPGSRLGVEAMTYPLVKAIAARLNISVVPLAMDAMGVTPEAIVAAHRAQSLRAIYFQPALHNPLGSSFNQARREEIARILNDTGIIAVEDSVYSFLAQEEPIAALAPASTLVVDSLSKRIAPGLSLGFVVAPVAWAEKVAVAARSGGWSASTFALTAGMTWIMDGTASRIAEVKRQNAARRFELAQRLLHGLVIKGDPRAFHVWVELPNCWRAEAFAAAAAAMGISITPAGAFSVVPGYSPNAVRLALALPPDEDLARALAALRRLAFTTDYELIHH